MTRPRLEPVWRAVVPENANPELLDEELKLWRQLMDMLKQRLPEGAPADRLGDFLVQIRGEDADVAALADRLDEVVAANPGSVIYSLWEWDQRKGRD